MRLKVFSSDPNTTKPEYHNLSLWIGELGTYILVRDDGYHEGWSAHLIEDPTQMWRETRWSTPEGAVEGLSPAPRTVLVWE